MYLSLRQATINSVHEGRSKMQMEKFW